MFAKAMKHRNSAPYISQTCKLSFSKIQKFKNKYSCRINLMNNSLQLICQL